MGQQQLILLVLATVIVGLAIIVGITAFTENSRRAAADAMTQDAIRIANDLQAWKKKPAPFGGQEEGAAKVDPADFSTLTDVVEIGLTSYDGGLLKYANNNGCFTITPGTATTTINGVNETEATEIQIELTGVTDNDIAMTDGFPLLGTSTGTNDCGDAVVGGGAAE